MNKIICRSKLRYPLTKDFDKHFFSLADYHNSFFTSNDPKKIMVFYNHFKTNEELIEWMKNRPKGASYIHEVDGRKDIVVVITTADFNGKYAKTCRDEIFKGLHIIFVESGGRGDYYFNYAHNCNVGIKKALEYNPKWIIVSNDDMYKIDDINILINELKKIDEKIIDCVFPNYSINANHSLPSKLCLLSTFGIHLYSLRAIHSLKLASVIKNFSKKYIVSIVDTKKVPTNLKLKIFVKLFSTEILPYYSIGSFGIFSSNMVRKYNSNLFDTTYINAWEDVDLSVEVSKNHKVAFINYNIGGETGGTINWNSARNLRDVINGMYFYNKHINLFK